jgi:hypothetical protein
MIVVLSVLEDEETHESALPAREVPAVEDAVVGRASVEEPP